jgi:hypothetical protein
MTRSLVLVALLGFAMGALSQAFAGDGTTRADEVRTESDPRIRYQHGVEIIYGIEPKKHRVQIETDGYAVQSQERQDLGREVDHMIRIYRNVLGVHVDREFGVGLEIHGDRSSYEEKQGSGAPTAGFYRHDKREAVVSGDRSRKQTHNTALHESSHAVLMDQVPGAPRWLNEGLAEYFEPLQASPSGRAYIPAQPQRHAYLRLLLANDRLLPLERLVALSPGQWASLPPEGMALVYEQSWSLVSFMMDRRSTRAELAGLLGEFRSQPATNGAAAIERHRDGGLADLEQAWHRWLGNAPREHGY